MTHFKFTLYHPTECSAMVRRVAVVGAGSSGLACIRACVDEGLEPVCFESSSDIGGLWRFKVSEGTVLNINSNHQHKFMCFYQNRVLCLTVA